MSKLSLGVEKMAANLPATLPNIDKALAAAGGDVRKVRLLEELAKAAQGYATTDEEKKTAVVAKWKIARHGGQVLIDMAKRGERKLSGKSPGLELFDLGISKNRSSRWQQTARLSEGRFADILDAVAGLDPDSDLSASGGAHVSANSGESEWFTPKAYIDAAVAVMGDIDLDPASTETANTVVGATKFYTAEQNGLRLPWSGRVWLNPPYRQPLVWLFSERLSDEFAAGNVEQACVLVNNATETAFFQRMAEVAGSICFPTGRVKFWHPERESAPLQGQAVLYFGDNIDAFRTEFLRFGFTVAL